MTGVEEGLLPHSNSFEDPDALEEILRLAYVGITRARERLYLTRARMRSSWGAPVSNPPSRFLAEIPPEVLDLRGEEGSGGAGTAPRTAPWRSGARPAGRGGAAVEVVSLTPGDRVSHPKFGLGTVVTASGQGDRAEASIDFDVEGTKRLLLRYAPVAKV